MLRAPASYQPDRLPVSDPTGGLTRCRDDDEVGTRPAGRGKAATAAAFPGRPGPGLTAYLRQFGLTLGDLRPPQVPMFLAARKLAGVVRELQIPVATRLTPDGRPMLTERQGEGGAPGLSASPAVSGSPGSSGERGAVWPAAAARSAAGVAGPASRLPTDEVKLGFLRATEDLPNIFPGQWLMEEVTPDWFYYKLATRDLSLPQWQQEKPAGDGRGGFAGGGEWLAGRGVGEVRRQHAYLLLDVSGSMIDSDRRGTVARGLALAFVLEGWRQGARLHLRPFATEVGDLLSGSSYAQFQKIVHRIISLENAGGTGIQPALERAAAEIRAGGRFACADIMLITDGVSRLGENPLESERLHSFVLGADQWCDGPVEHETITRLKEWSTTWHRMRAEGFRELVLPEVDDLAELLQVYGSLTPESLADLAPEQRAEVAAALANALYLEEQFRTNRGDGGTGFPTLRQRLKALQRQVAQAGAGAGPASGRASGRAPAGSPAAATDGGDGAAPGNDPAARPGGHPLPRSGRSVSLPGLDFADFVLGWWRLLRLALGRLFPRLSR